LIDNKHADGGSLERVDIRDQLAWVRQDRKSFTYIAPPEKIVPKIKPTTAKKQILNPESPAKYYAAKPIVVTQPLSYYIKLVRNQKSPLNS
jgi:hypothetical protein